MKKATASFSFILMFCLAAFTLSGNAMGGRDYVVNLGYDEDTVSQIYEVIDDVVEAGKDFYKAKNYTNAWACFKTAATAGDVEGAYYLAKCYFYGQGVAKNHKQAFKWYTFSAKQGHSFAQSDLGTMYLQGYGVTKNYTEAAKWYRKAAEQGNPWGQYNLGRMYEYGYGVKRSLPDANYWYRLSAEQGNKKAMEKLGMY